MKVYFYTNFRGNWFYGSQRLEYWHRDFRWITACNGWTINNVFPLNVLFLVTVAHLEMCSHLRYWLVKGMCQFHKYIDDSEHTKDFLDMFVIRNNYICFTAFCKFNSVSNTVYIGS